MEHCREVGIRSVVRYRINPPPKGWEPDGWRSAYNSITGLRLRISDEAVEIRGFGAFRKAFGLQRSLPPRETTISTVRLGSGIAGFRSPWPHADYLALTCKLPGDSEYTLAVRPRRGQLDLLKDALKAVGVREWEG